MDADAGERIRALKIKRVFVLMTDILFLLFFLICVFALSLSLTAKKDHDGAMWLFGYRLYIVESSSMEKCALTDVSDFKIKDLPVRSMVFVQAVPKDATEAENWYGSLRVGDILTFRYVYTRQETITHRIIEISAKETGGHIITLEGDNKTTKSGALHQTIDTSSEDSPNYVIGKVVGKSIVLGFLVTMLKSAWGILFIDSNCSLFAHNSFGNRSAEKATDGSW